MSVLCGVTCMPLFIGFSRRLYLLTVCRQQLGLGDWVREEHPRVVAELGKYLELDPEQAGLYLPCVRTVSFSHLGELLQKWVKAGALGLL